MREKNCEIGNKGRQRENKKTRERGTKREYEKDVSLKKVLMPGFL